MDRQSQSRQDVGRHGRNQRKATWHTVLETYETPQDDYGLRRDAGVQFNQGQDGFGRDRYADRVENYRSGHRQAPRRDAGEGYGGPVDLTQGRSVEGYGGQSGYGTETFAAGGTESSHASVRSDLCIVDEVRELLADNPSLDARDIDAAIFQGVVTLQGTVPEHSMRNLAENLVAYCPGVRHVRNRLTIGGAFAPPAPATRSVFNGENS